MIEVISKKASEDFITRNSLHGIKINEGTVADLKGHDIAIEVFPMPLGAMVIKIVGAKSGTQDTLYLY